MRSTERTDIYTRVTNEIVAAIEAGAGSWTMPWHHDGSAISRPVNAGTCKTYRGSNILSLWIAAQAAGYTSGRWASYRQWQALGAQVRKGEQATTIVFWKINQRGEDADDGDHEQEGRGRARMFARGYSVFNEAQVEGYAAPSIDLLSDEARLQNADAFWSNLGIVTRHSGNEAYYVPSEDRVQMPEFAQFKDPAGYYGTLYHEGLHATGAAHRCDRDLAGRFGSDRYAAEEAIADLGAALIMADLGIAHHPRPDIASWLKVLKADARAIFTLASKAQAAADWMHAQQPDSVLSKAA
jgi:antirestriction protein ArdC